MAAEPTITINGTELTPAQAMAVRVAVTVLAEDTEGMYAARLLEVLRLMLPPASEA